MFITNVLYAVAAIAEMANTINSIFVYLYNRSIYQNSIMRILFISDTLLTGDFVLRLQEEGNDVKLFIKDISLRNCYENLITKVESWKDELEWVGKDGLIVFDDIGFGKDQDRLREDGYTVFGGTERSELLELDRMYANFIFSKYGMDELETHNFDDASDAIDFIHHNEGPWVMKYSKSHWMKPYAFIGDAEDGSDVVAVLQNYAEHKINTNQTVTIQKRVYGIKIGVARYFNGTDWVGPIEYNIEHTHLFPGNIGPMVDEMGTLSWYSEDESERLFNQSLNRIKPFLADTNFKGNVDIECIVNEEGVYPLEATVRFGAPAIHLQKTLHISPWGEFLHAIAQGKQPDLKYKNGFGIVISVALPPFPYAQESIGSALLGTKIHILNKDFLTIDDQIHFDEVASADGTLDTLYIAGKNGYAYYATGVAPTIAKARAKALAAIKGVYVPRMFYRDDIGLKFEKEEFKQLKQWGYLSKTTNKSRYSLWK